MGPRAELVQQWAAVEPPVVSMSDLTPAPPPSPGAGSRHYESVSVVVVPEAPHHYSVSVRDEDDEDDERVEFAVERVAVNSTRVRLEGSVWFVDADLDVGVPFTSHGETAWVWP